MRRIDLLIGGVIIAAVIFSFLGVATYEAAPGDVDYDITWAAKTQDLPQKTASQTGNGEQTVEIPINVQNLTKVDFTVTVSNGGPRAQAVTATITVTPVNASGGEPKSVTLPQGAMASAPQATFSIPVASTPNATTASGPDENATQQELAAQHTSRDGIGTWRIKVVISGAQGGAPVVGVGAQTFTITITGKTSAYSATLQPATPDINR